MNRWTTSRDHTVLSLACAGGHLGIVQYLIAQGADPSCCLKVGPGINLLSMYCMLPLFFILTVEQMLIKYCIVWVIVY